MFVLGLAGPAGAGKSEVAAYLEEAYGFCRVNFSDALYLEVQQAFGLETQDLLRNRSTKDTPQEALALKNLRVRDSEGKDIPFYMTPFFEVVTKIVQHPSNPWGMNVGEQISTRPLTPRQVLQLWGTEYRRAQHEGYWINKAGERIIRMHASAFYPEHRPRLFVNDTVRFEDERDWIHSLDGNIWHIHRDSLAPDTTGHVSAEPLPVLVGERELWNNSTLEDLRKGVDLMINTHARFVKMNPLRVDVDPEFEAQCIEVQQATLPAPTN